MEKSSRKPRPNERVLLHPVDQLPMPRRRLYERMLSLGKRAGVAYAHPHRSTFAVDMVARGASLYDVATLLGETIETVERHYAEFVSELRERARRMMESKDGGLQAFAAAAAADKPRRSTLPSRASGEILARFSALASKQ